MRLDGAGSTFPFCPVCTWNDYEACGSHHSVTFSQMGFKCSHCETVIQHSQYRDGGEILVFIAQSALADKAGGKSYPFSYVAWMNDVMLPTWRAKSESGDHEPAYPPKAPKLLGVAIFVHLNGVWHPIDQALSDSLVVPEDPILRRNREFFDEVWRRVFTSDICDPPERFETKNDYGGIEPWYMFQLFQGCRCTLGWRKRVVNITMVFPVELDLVEIVRLSQSDNVTCSADLVRSSHVNIHAWGLDKTVEYLRVLCLLAINSAPLERLAEVKGQ